MFKMKKLAAIATVAVMAVSTMSICVSAEKLVTNIVPIEGASNYDANLGRDDSWMKVVGYIYFENSQVGTITGIYNDNVFTDTVESKVSAANAKYVRYAIVSSATVSTSDDIENASAFSGKVNLSNNSARFGGGVYLPE